MRRVLIPCTIAAAFCAGLLAARTLPPAQAQTSAQTSAPAAAPAAALQPQVINLIAITDADLGNPVPNVGTLRTRTLVSLPQGTMALQTGIVPKHLHVDANEFQYVVAGSGTFWLGDQPQKVRTGDLIIIPKGTAHAGTVPDGPEFKVLAIKLPPQAPTDTTFVP